MTSPASEDDRRLLEELRAGGDPRASQRAEIVLRTLVGESAEEIRTQLRISDLRTVRKWLDRYAAKGVAGLLDRQRSGRPRKITEEAKDLLVHLIRDTRPPEDNADRWTFELLVEALDEIDSVGSVSNILRERWVDVPLDLNQGKDRRNRHKPVEIRLTPGVGISVAVPVKLMLQLDAEAQGTTLQDYATQRIEEDLGNVDGRTRTHLVLRRLIGLEPSASVNQALHELEEDAWMVVQDEERITAWRRSFRKRPVADPWSLDWNIRSDGEP